MNERELKIFNKGVEVGMNLEKEFAQTFKLLVTNSAKTIIRKGKRSKGSGKWTEEEDEIMRENKNLSGKELAKLFPHRNFSAIATHKSGLGLKADKVEDNGLARLNQK